MLRLYTVLMGHDFDIELLTVRKCYNHWFYGYLRFNTVNDDRVIEEKCVFKCQNLVI